MNNDLISRSAFLERMKRTNRYFDIKFDIMEEPAVDAVEVVLCKDCTLWDREHIEMHPHSTEHPEQQAEYGECRKWSTWSTCFMTRSDDYCSQAKRRDGDGEN